MGIGPGTRLGAYEVLSPLGAGGMGEVYRARDTNLKRDVAIKVLPDAFAQEPERLARFQREAEVLAALNHPNIAAVYGLEKSDGHVAIVLELVEGEDLAHRLERGAIPIDEASKIADQIANAIQAAHEQGIVHRDLKPANIKVRADGTVKVLDFGLAKALAPVVQAFRPAEERSPQGLHYDITQSPTITSPAVMTGVGTILGTAAYMSPEQAKGRAADKRSDVWAFGCVLFEMLTGTRAFGGDDVAETLAAVIRGEPDWAKLPRGLPASIVTLLRRTLDKDRARRIGEFSTVLFLLDEARQPATESRATSRRLSWWTRPLTAGAIAVALGASGLAVWALRRPLQSAPSSPTRFRVALPEGAALFVGTNPQPAVALSHDGTRLIFGARIGGKPSQLYVRLLDQFDATPIPGSDGAYTPVLSPDGQRVVFNTAGGAVNRLPITGGTPALVCTVTGWRGATWLPDDSILYADVGVGLMRVPAAGGTPAVVLAIDPKTQDAFMWPHALPGGRAVLFAEQHARASAAETSIGVLRLDTGEHKVLVERGSMPYYVSSGHLVFKGTAANTVFAVPFDLDSLEVRGAPVQVLDGTVAGVAANGAQLAVAESGTIAYVAGGPAVAARTLVWVDRNGTETPTSAPRHNYENPRLSPDESKVLVSITGVENGSPALRDVWLFDLVRSTLSRLTSESIEAEKPVWTPDGRYIVYAVQKPDRRDFVRRPADGSGAEEVIASTDRHLHGGSWTPDGQSLLAVVATGVDSGTFWLVRPNSVRPFMRSAAQLQAPMLSPDGRWLAYASNETGAFEVYVQAFPGPGAKYHVSSDGGTEPLWSRSGREMFYRNNDDVMAVRTIAKGASLDVGTPAKLFSGHLATVGGTNRDTFFDVSLDGQRFLMVKPETGGGTDILVVRDWIAELKARVPVR